MTWLPLAAGVSSDLLRRASGRGGPIQLSGQLVIPRLLLAAGIARSSALNVQSPIIEHFDPRSISSFTVRMTDGRIVQRLEIVLVPKACYGLALKTEQRIRLVPDCTGRRIRRHYQRMIEEGDPT